MEFKQHSLFERKPEPEKTGYESIYQPNENTDRYVLINHNTKERFACKFYKEDEDEFFGQGCLAMYNLNKYFDRSILKEVK